MKYKITSIERSVGLFLLISFAGMFFLSAGILTRSLFWQNKINFKLKISTAGQLQEGSKVQIKGINIGKVVKIMLNDNAEIIATFEVGSEYYKFFTINSQMVIVNPMIIGDKIVELEYNANPKLAAIGSFLPVKENEDIINKLSGIEWKSISPILENIRATVIRANTIAGKVDSQLPRIFEKTHKISSEAEQAIMGTNKLIADLQEATPLLKTAAKDLPDASAKSVNAISEAIIVLRSMQKTWFLKSGAEEVKKEIAKENEVKLKDIERAPANTK
jgi:phospholipid/cholesterol/gamma-HCH transport system substrate-binding protein